MQGKQAACSPRRSEVHRVDRVSRHGGYETVCVVGHVGVDQLREAHFELGVAAVELLLELLDHVRREDADLGPSALGAVELELPAVRTRGFDLPRVDEPGIAVATDVKAMPGGVCVLGA